VGWVARLLTLLIECLQRPSARRTRQTGPSPLGTLSKKLKKCGQLPPLDGPMVESNSECFISVDVETSGPIPGEYSMLAIGACVVGRTAEAFYAELQPITPNAIPEALAVTGFNLEELARQGEAPYVAMTHFRDWLRDVCTNRTPVFVGFNAGFDWTFVNWYFHRFLGQNPFGIAPLDIKSYYMGLSGVSWAETKSSRLPSQFRPPAQAGHNALNDARSQAEMFQKMRCTRA
jgi:ribonuclease T